MKKELIGILFLLALVGSVSALPDISSIAGNISHGENVTIQGIGFGIKENPLPVIWDDCSGTNITNKWYINLNNMSPAEYIMRYTAPEELGRGVATAHEHVTRYAAGAHCCTSGAYSGSQVGLVGEIPNLILPVRVYMSYYFRVDPNWNWFAENDQTCEGPAVLTGCSNNFKLQYLKRFTWYSEQKVYLERVNSCPTAPCMIRGTYYGHVPGTTPEGLADNQGIEGLSGALPLLPEQGWYKVEHEFYITSDSSSRVRTWLNGSLQHDWTGYSLSPDNSTVNWYFTALTYASDRDPNNWKYLNDLYLDASSARVMLCPTNDWANRGNCEVQIPQAWSNGSITFQVNQGSFSDGETAYVFVVDEDGEVGEGYPINISGEFLSPEDNETCGNSYCNATAGENCSTCWQDCGNCTPIYATPHVQDYITLQEMLGSIEDYKRGLTPIEQVVANIRKWVWG